MSHSEQDLEIAKRVKDALLGLDIVIQLTNISPGSGVIVETHKFRGVTKHRFNNVDSTGTIELRAPKGSHITATVRKVGLQVFRYQSGAGIISDITIPIKQMHDVTYYGKS